MINFKTKLPKWEIHDDNGNLVNAHELPDKSITTEAMADEFLLTQHHTNSYMKALDNNILLEQFMKHLERLADSCVEKSKSDKHWDSIYNTSIVYLLDNFLVRYANLFKDYVIDTTYSTQSEIKVLYVKACNGAHVSFNGVEIANPIHVKLYRNDLSKISANSAGFKTLIPHYTNEQFLETLKTYLDNCRYSSDQVNFWFIVEELIRRIENGEI